MTSRPRSSAYVVGAFAGVVALLLVTNGVSLYELRVTHNRVREIIANATVSIRLVSRMSRDVDRQRILLERHIFEGNASAMARVEVRLAIVQADYDAAAREYGPLAVFPGEADAWHDFQRQVAALAAPMAETLELSRRNQDDEARAALAALESRFAVIDSHAATLVRINQANSDKGVMEVQSLQRTTTALLVALGLLAAVVTVVIGVWTTRIVRQQEHEREQHAAQMEARNRELDAFAGRVAHDLRGPLAIIGMAAAVLGRPGADVPATVAILRGGVRRMETMIQDLLDLSRVEADARAGSADPALVAAQLREELTPRLQEARATLRVAVEPAQVQCPEGLLRQVLANLADNALKYARADALPEIAIGGGIASGRYELKVADNGIGMSSDEARHAFDPFYRAPRAREAPGTGLGLSIVKRVVEANGGTIAVESKLGHGTTFVIRLPLHAPEPAAAAG